MLQSGGLAYLTWRIYQGLQKQRRDKSELTEKDRTYQCAPWPEPIDLVSHICRLCLQHLAPIFSGPELVQMVWGNAETLKNSALQ